MKIYRNVITVILALLASAGITAAAQLTLTAPDFYPGYTGEFTLAGSMPDGTSAVQFTLEIPEGFTLYNSRVTLASGRGTDHKVIVNSKGGNVYKCLVYSQTAAPLAGGDGPLVTFKLKAASSTTKGYYPLVISDIIMADASGTESREADIEQELRVYIRATKISIDPTRATITPGQTVQLAATVLPDEAADQQLTWSSSREEVATVDATGMVTGVAVGSTNITVRTTDGTNRSATCTITVEPIKVSGITLSQTELSMVRGSEAQLSATVTPDNASNPAVEWFSSSTSTVTVDSDGKLTARATGTATITCRAKDGSGVQATCKVTVTPLMVSGITLSDTRLEMNIGGTHSLSATVAPSNADNRTVTWSSSDETVATVSGTGYVKAINNGTATITCTAQDGSGVKATCEVTVTRRYVTSITLNYTQLSLKVGASYSLRATVAPSNADTRDVGWSSTDAKVATVSDNGRVTAIAPGTATIICEAKDGSGVKATCEVTVRTGLVESITLSETHLSLNVGNRHSLTATIAPADADNQSVGWSSSDESVATVTSGGYVTATGEGTATITCAAQDGSGVKATCTVSVGLPPATSVTVTPAIKSIKVGETFTVKATVKPSAASQVVKWSSSNPEVLTVDDTGLCTGIAPGEATITATAADGSGCTGFCMVSVMAVPVTRITLSHNTLSMVRDSEADLTATVTPSNATNPAVAWTSSSPSTVSVDNEGHLRALATGTARIICAAEDGSGVKAECTVTVTPKLTTGITLSESAITLMRGGSYMLTATVEPADADNTGILWESSDWSVAQIEPTGEVKAVGVGEAVITVSTSDGSGHKAECRVTVTPKLATNLTLNASNIELAIGNTFDFETTVEPADADDVALRWWSTDESVVTVNEKGKAVAVGVGVARVKVEVVNGSGGAECVVNVILPLPVEVVPCVTSLTMVENTDTVLTAYVRPDLAIQEVIWTSTDEEVVTVTPSGEVHAVAPGYAQLIVMSSASPEVTATVDVEVIAGQGGIDAVTGQAVKVYTSGGMIVISGKDPDGIVVVTDITGRRIYSGTSSCITPGHQGLYLVEVDRRVYKVQLR